MGANDPDQPGGQVRVTPNQTWRNRPTNNNWNRVYSTLAGTMGQPGGWNGLPVSDSVAKSLLGGMKSETMAGAPAMNPWSWLGPTGGPGTGRRLGGGGGGGGMQGFNQAQVDAIARLFGGNPQQMAFNPFQGPAARPFDSSMYDKLDADVKGAAAKDKAASGAAYDQLANTLQSTYKNAYANAPTTATPQVQDSMRNLLAAQGATGGAAGEAIQAENAYSQNSDGAFGNLLAVLAAGADQSQASRMAQVGMDKNTSGQNIDAAASGYGAGIGMARTRAQQDYQKMLDDRAYQEAMMNWQGQQQTNQANVGINNDWMMSRLDPLMQLILGAPGMNYASLFGG